MRSRLFTFIIFLFFLSISNQVYCQEFDNLTQTIKEFVLKSDYVNLELVDWKRIKEDGLMQYWEESQTKNPLNLAVERNDYKMIKYLLSKDVPQYYLMDQDIVSYLSKAIQAGQVDILKNLIDAGLRPEFNDLFRCDSDSDLDMLKIILPYNSKPLKRYKITEWGEPTGGTTSYLRFLAEQTGADMLLAFLLSSNPELVNIVYSNYSAVSSPIVVSHLTLADIVGDRLSVINPKLTLMKAEELFALTKYPDIEKVFPNTYTLETTVRLRLREAPDLLAKTITILETGTRVKIFESNRMSGTEVIDGISSVWYYIVTSNEERGWVWGGYLIRASS